MSNDFDPASKDLGGIAKRTRKSGPWGRKPWRDAVNLAKVEAIRLEFNRRPDRENMSIPFRTTFAKLEFPQAVAAKQTIGKIGSIAMFSEQRFLEVTTGRATNPADRLTAARLASAA